MVYINIDKLIICFINEFMLHTRNNECKYYDKGY